MGSSVVLLNRWPEWFALGIEQHEGWNHSTDAHSCEVFGFKCRIGRDALQSRYRTDNPVLWIFLGPACVGRMEVMRHGEISEDAANFVDEYGLDTGRADVDANQLPASQN